MNAKRISTYITSPNAKLWFSAVLVLIAIILLSITISVQNTNAKLIHVRPGNAYQLKQTIHSGDVIMSVASVRFDEGKKPFAAAPDKTYAIVDLSIKNISDTPIQILPSNDTYVKNAKGDVSYLSPFPLEQPFRAGELAPGEQIHGDLSYLINKADTVKLYVDAKWSGIAVPITLQDKER